MATSMSKSKSKSQPQPQTTRVHPVRVGSDSDSDSPPSDEFLEWIVWLMDRSFRIPGTKIRFGLDPLMGILPIGGDAAAGIIQAAFVLLGVFHYKVPKPIVARMAANVLLDTTVGSVPILGTIFDVFFRANTRNLTLLREVQEQRKLEGTVSTGPSIRYLIIVGLMIATMFAFMVALFVVGIIWLVGLLSDRPVI
ncbi:DUF4112 domain-containing protein [soil metagenome]